MDVYIIACKNNKKKNKYDLIDSTLSVSRSYAIHKFVKDKNLNPEDLSWIKLREKHNYKNQPIYCLKRKIE